MRIGHAARVAAVTTAAIAVVYVACVMAASLVVSAHLAADADARLAARVAELRHDRDDIAQQVGRPDVGADGDNDGADQDGSPVLAWLVSATGQATVSTPGAPALPAGLTAGARDGQLTTTTLGQSGAYRLRLARNGAGWLVAGVSRAASQRTESLLLTGEVSAGPVLLLAMFAGALLIGLRAQAPVEQSRRRQLEFTADASHELRTPLSVIRAETDLALAGPRDAAGYRDTLERIEAETRRLRRLVEDMLWLARFDSQPPRRDDGPVDLATVAQATADRFRSVGPAVSAAVTAGPALVNAPPEWVDRLAGVLMDNACRHAGPGGQVRIGVAVTGSRATLTVEDTGPGIPADQRPRLFDRFWRAADRQSGAGLGLAIGDSVVRSTGGRWEVGDSPLGGARFTVSWRNTRPHRPGGAR
jgi:signal transduction histidine kinase